MNKSIPNLGVNKIFSKNNYDRDCDENEIIFPNNEKKEDFINLSKKLPFEEKPELNRISNLKDNELPLEDQLQIQKQINDDNDNDNDDQIEVIENILNNFGKEKLKDKKFLMYKYKSSFKKKYKSNSVINRNNNKILNKIKNYISLINFQQEINKIHKLHNYKIFLKSERAHFNSIKKNDKENNNLNQENKNKKRIEEIKKKLFSKKEQNNNNNNQNNIKRLINNFNLNRKRENFFNSKNEKAFNQILEVINNLKQSKINNNNNNNNDVCYTFRSGNNPLNISSRKKLFSDDNEDYLKTEESTKISLSNSNQFFYNVYNNSVKKYPYLHILKNKINKMRKFDLSQSKNKLKERNRTNNKITLLDKINSQKDIFQREIEKYNSK